LTKIAFVFADTPTEWNCSQWRVVNPAWGLRRIGIETDEVWIADWGISHLNKDQRKRVEGADVVLLQRNAFEGALDALKFWRERDKPVWIDLDDAYQMLPETNNAKRFWHDNAMRFNRNPLEQLREGLSIATGLTSPNKLILEDWQSPRKLWLPNYVRGEWYANVKRQEHDGIIIGWGASMSHYDSYRYSGVAVALSELCRRRADVRVVVCSNDRTPYEMLDCSPTQKMYQSGVPYTEWPQFVALFDLGIAPLYGEYDKRRSWLKVIEYACAGVPCIVSDSPAYADCREWPLAMVGPGAWATALDSALSQLQEAKNIAWGKRFEAALQFSIESQAGVWAKGLMG
jgi:hypothetical protein